MAPPHTNCAAHELSGARTTASDVAPWPAAPRDSIRPAKISSSRCPPRPATASSKVLSAACDWPPRYSGHSRRIGRLAFHTPGRSRRCTSSAWCWIWARACPTAPYDPLNPTSLSPYPVTWRTSPLEAVTKDTIFLVAGAIGSDPTRPIDVTFSAEYREEDAVSGHALESLDPSPGRSGKALYDLLPQHLQRAAYSGDCTSRSSHSRTRMTNRRGAAIVSVSPSARDGISTCF